MKFPKTRFTPDPNAEPIAKRKKPVDQQCLGTLENGSACKRRLPYNPNQRLCNVCKQRNAKQGKLVAGELGYTIGRTYTSLSGFCTRPDREWRHFGTLQMVMLAEHLRDLGYAFWNMGHPVQKYKRALGARVIAREEFLLRWLGASCEEPDEVLGASVS